ncbi:MAG: endoplasmic oxidoreductin-1 [Thelocarpon superellum]|nr:MAG: endoplasmic oxidoreductin-1 [Thelocarpon superellum]
MRPRSATQAFYLAAFAWLSRATAAGHHGLAPGKAEVCAIEPKAIVSDACASYSTLDSLNRELTPALKDITQTTDFFAYYRLNLFNRVCPFWTDSESMCGNIACAVYTLDSESDIPLIWRAEELGKLEGPKAGHPGRRLQQERHDRQERPLQGQLGEDVGESCVLEADDECDERDYCVPEDESSTVKGDYVSLVDNPERFTGYAGTGARQVWDSIYRENCFSKALSKGSGSQGASAVFPGQAADALKSVIKDYGRSQAVARSTQPVTVDDGLDFDNECLEKRVFYRIISGMHASISAHICWDYLNQTTGMWGPNLSCYQERLDQHPERISNLYFNYALVLRAVTKLRTHLKGYTFCSGDVEQDRFTKQKVLALTEKAAAGPAIFDESLMFQDPSTVGLKEDFRNRFRNVSRMMDCVGCDKCRLWGKVQTAGYGTALKVLFEFGDDADRQDEFPLRRTELVALINTLDKISTSITAVSRLREVLAEQHDQTIVGSSSEAIGNGDERDDIADEELGEDFGEYEPIDPSEAMWEEWYRIWRVFGYVIRSWFVLPGTM